MTVPGVNGAAARTRRSSAEPSSYRRISATALSPVAAPFVPLSAVKLAPLNKPLNKGESRDADAHYPDRRPGVVADRGISGLAIQHLMGLLPHGRTGHLVDYPADFGFCRGAVAT